MDELDVLRSAEANPHAARLFADMTRDEINQAIMKVVQIPDEQIRQVILDNGGSPALVKKMLARKADMASRMGVDQVAAEGTALE